jgi:2-iminoacetate synthase ThiH
MEENTITDPFGIVMSKTEKNREAALEKGSLCTRLNREEALVHVSLSNPSDIHRLGKAALRNRVMRYGRCATYIENLVVNPSNICEGKCRFCHYWVEKKIQKLI